MRRITGPIARNSIVIGRGYSTVYPKNSTRRRSWNYRIFCIRRAFPGWRPVWKCRWTTAPDCRKTVSWQSSALYIVVFSERAFEREEEFCAAIEALSGLWNAMNREGMDLNGLPTPRAQLQLWGFSGRRGQAGLSGQKEVSSTIRLCTKFKTTRCNFFAAYEYDRRPLQDKLQQPPFSLGFNS